jgi:glyoxylate reductase
VRVVVTSPLPVDVAPFLGPGVEVIAAERAMTRAELLEAVTSADGLICLLHDRIDDELLARAPRLRAVGNYAVGVDNIDLAACARRQVVVCNTPDVLTEATADLTFALLLAVARRVCEGDALLRAGGWRGWEPGLLLGAEVHGRTLGLVGFGRIGQAVARRAAGFAMRVIRAGRGDPLAPVLRDSDFVSIHCPLNAETRGLIGAAQLELMKPSAILINTARGPIVDEPALAAALEAGIIAGAGLDVFAEEPRVHPALLRQPRAVLLPHVGSATRAARARMAELAATGVRELLAGRRPPNLVTVAASTS